MPITTKIKKVFANKELRNKILFTLFVIGIIRVLNTVPIPGFTKDVIGQTSGDNPFSTFFTLITGGRIDSLSLVAIGIGPYINASIILQLLTSVIPGLEELSKEGERGREVINQYTRYLTLPLSVIQSIVIVVLVLSQMESQPQLQDFVAALTSFDKAVMIASLSAGSMLLMWLGERITDRGIGNGASLIITIGILGSLPSLIKQDFSRIKFDVSNVSRLSDLFRSDSLLPIVLLIVGLIAMIAGIVFVTEATRRLKIQYARRVRTSGAMQSSFLPIKLNQAGVIPVIFASSLLSFPQIIAQFVVNQTSTGVVYDVATKLNNSFLTDFSSTGYLITYFLLIVIFSFFYTFVVMKPNEVADNLKKSGGFIPGIRPGESTAHYISRVLIKLTSIGSMFLAGVALVPTLFRLGFDSDEQLLVLSGIGGTSILIIVGVLIDTYRQIGAFVVTSSYEKYK